VLCGIIDESSEEPPLKNPSVAAILLAAGGSSRIGSPKQLLPYRERSLLRYAAEIAVESNAGQTFAVLGYELERMKAELRGLDVGVIENLDWESGIASSIHVAISSLPSAFKAAIILLCDQPLITSELLDVLIKTQEETGKPIVACRYEDTIGVPALFDRSLFPELMLLNGDHGAKQLITKHGDQAALIPFPGGTVDIDTLADYEQHVTPRSQP
jgi:molybdenum cofactor cytidylyltransferase